jgi:hypothetical protein
MYANSLHGNWDIPGTTGCHPQSVRSRKACGRNLDMHVNGKSDGVILSMKRANKGIQPNIGQLPAEFVEKRPPAEGNTGQLTVTATQGAKVASSVLPKVREAAKRDSKLQFSNLLHHINVDLLRQSYWELNRQAATGIDDVTWQE